MKLDKTRLASRLGTQAGMISPSLVAVMLRRHLVRNLGNSEKPGWDPGTEAGPVVFVHGWFLNWSASSSARHSALLLCVSVVRFRDVL